MEIRFSMTPTSEKVTFEDVPAIHAMGENVNEFHTSDQAPNFWPEAILRECISKDDVYFFVAATKDGLVGFVIANLNRSLSKALIENIFVNPEFRGQGIGTSLAKRVIDTAKANNYRFISVLTPPDDIPAIKTYEKAGFSKGDVFLWLDA